MVVAVVVIVARDKWERSSVMSTMRASDRVVVAESGCFRGGVEWRSVERRRRSPHFSLAVPSTSQSRISPLHFTPHCRR